MTERRPGSLGLLPLCFLLLSSACTGPVAVRPVTPPSVLVAGPERPRAQPESLALDQLPQDTQLTLRLFHLEDELAAAPEAAFRALDVLYAEHGEGRFAAAAAEVAFSAARQVMGDSGPAASWYLLAASRAYDYLVGEAEVTVQRAYHPEFQDMIGLYRRAVAEYLTLLPGLHGGLVDHRQPTVWDTFELEWAEGPGLWEPERFDRILPVDELEVEGLRNHYHRHGLGAPLVAIRQNLHTDPVDEFFPPEGVIRAATAVMAFEPLETLYPGGLRKVSLRCYDPMRVDEVELGEVPVPLAADFTTPYAYLASQADFTKSLLRAEKAWAELGLFLVEPYDPNKIPVILLHGLRSTPLAWLELTNDLLGDPVIRNSYQVWHFTYPTSLPYLYTGSLLRDAMHDLRAAVDAGGDDPAFDSMVLVGHSLGGLIARSLVTDSGDRLWSVMMTVGPEELRGDPEDVQRLRQILLLEPVPAVDRVVFIATPHGGSALALSFVGRLGAALVDPPSEFRELFSRLTRANPGAVNEELEKVLKKGGPNSIQGLSPNHPMLWALATLPIAPGVTYHTIVGDRGTPAEPRFTDGVVPFASASIPGAASERVVYGSGHDVYAHPLAITEVKRILRRHLEERRGTSGSPARR